jgi:hypothetical protein
MATKKPKEEKPEILEEEEEKRQEETQEPEVVDYVSEINLKALKGKVIKILSAEVQPGQKFDIARLTIEVDGQIMYAISTNKPIIRAVQQMIQQGLGKKAFRVCVDTVKTQYGTESAVLKAPVECQKK